MDKNGEVLALRIGHDSWPQIAVVFDGFNLSPEKLMIWVETTLRNGKVQSGQKTLDGGVQLNLIMKDGNGNDFLLIVTYFAIFEIVI